MKPSKRPLPQGLHILSRHTPEPEYEMRTSEAPNAAEPGTANPATAAEQSPSKPPLSLEVGVMLAGTGLGECKDFAGHMKYPSTLDQDWQS